MFPGYVPVHFQSHDKAKQLIAKIKLYLSPRQQHTPGNMCQQVYVHSKPDKILNA